MITTLILSAAVIQAAPVYTPEDENAIGTFINVPWQTYPVGTVLPVGVAAYHLEGVDRVDFFLETPLKWDLNNDGVVNGVDQAILMGAWGISYDGADLSELLGEWGQTNRRFIGSASVETNASTGDGDIGYWIDLPLTKVGDHEITAVIVPTVGIPTTLSGTYTTNPDYYGLSVRVVETLPVTEVTTQGELDAAASGNAPFIRIVTPGDYLLPTGGNTDEFFRTIEGVPGVRIVGNGSLSGNWKLRDLYVTGDQTLQTSRENHRYYVNLTIEGGDPCVDRVFGPANGVLWLVDCHLLNMVNMGYAWYSSNCVVDGLGGDLYKTNQLHYIHGTVVLRHGVKHPDVNCADSAVHSDVIQTNGGTRDDNDVSEYNKIIRFTTSWNGLGGQVWHGSFNRQEERGVITSYQYGFAIIGNRWGSWADMDSYPTTYSSTTVKIGAPARNFLVQDNLIFGSAAMWDGDPNGNGIVEADWTKSNYGYAMPRRYHNFKWAYNYRYTDKVDFTMPGPDAPVGFYSSWGQPVDDRFTIGVDSFPYLSPITGIYYVGGDGVNFTYAKRGDYEGNTDLLP